MRVRTLDSRLSSFSTVKREAQKVEKPLPSQPTEGKNPRPYITFLKELTEFQLRAYKKSSLEEDLYLKTLNEELRELEGWLQNLQGQNQS